jgi:type IV pilus assembly protein PilA
MNTQPAPKQGMSRKTLFIIIGVGAVALACPCIGIMAAIAIPNFIRFQARSRQAECKVNLKSFYSAARVAMESEENPGDLAKMGFEPARGNRYAYFVGHGPLEERGAAQVKAPAEVQAIGVDTLRFPKMRPLTFRDLPPDVASQVGVSGQCPDCTVTMACAGDIDNNDSDTPDVWSISTQDRKTPEGETIPAGQPYNHFNDVTGD